MSKCVDAERFFARPRIPDPLPNWPIETQEKPHESIFLEKWSAETQCAVCLQDMIENTKVYVKGCLHPFCYICISEWMEKNKESITTCPKCKHQTNEVYAIRNGKVELIQVVQQQVRFSWSEFAETPRPMTPGLHFFDPEDVYFVAELNPDALDYYETGTPA